jgi:hypothetical protein
MLIKPADSSKEANDNRESNTLHLQKIPHWGIYLSAKVKIIQLLGRKGIKGYHQWVCLIQNCTRKPRGDSWIAKVNCVESSRTTTFVARLTVIVDLWETLQLKGKVMHNTKQRYLLRAMSAKAMWLSSSKSMEQYEVLCERAAGKKRVYPDKL